MQVSLQNGADNLLKACGGLSAGQTLLVLHEAAELDYYDHEIVQAVVDRARGLGIAVEADEVPFSPDGANPCETLIGRMKAADRTLFLARFGDQIRFSEAMSGISPIMCYALDAGMLSSGFGQADYHAFVALKDLINGHLAQSEEIHVTCPLGTDFKGQGAQFPRSASDVSVTRFPMSVFAPVPAGNFSGRVVQHGFLVGTGSRFYQPYACTLENPVSFSFRDGRITGVDGADADVGLARQHYERIGAQYDIDPWVMHSWHAGIHPGCAYERPVASNFERWSGAAFGNPRLLHFHTCGAYAPGEISLNVLDPTIRVDGISVWDKGRLEPSRIPGGAEIIEAHPEIAALFANPARAVGQCPEETLSGSWS